MTKKGSSEENRAKSKDLSSFQSLKQDEDYNVFRILLKSIKEKYDISSSDVLRLLQKEIQIPCTIFTKRLSPLETVVKYLREGIQLDNSKIAEFLGRDKKTIWQAYRNASKKVPVFLEARETKYNIPVAELKTDLSMLEAVVAYLKEHFNLSYHEIAQLIHRNDRTIWTVYSRALKKRKHESK